LSANANSEPDATSEKTAVPKELMALNGHKDQVTSVAWSPNGQQLLTGSGDATARIWDVGAQNRR